MSVTREKLLSLGQKAVELLPIFSLIVGGIAVCLMAGLVVAEILARNVFHYGIPFAVEYAEYAVPAVGVVGAAYALRKGEHVKADIFLHRLPDRPRQWLILVGYILGLGFLIILATQSFTIALNNIKMHVVVALPTRTPIGYPQLVLAIGFSLFALQLVIEILRKARLIFLSYK